MPKNPCRETGCAEPKYANKQSCLYHWLLGQPIDLQVQHANRRLAATDEATRRARVPAAEWPEGTRWCAGCQTFVPLFYAPSSRCRACSSAAAHASRVKATYGISGADYEALLRWQGGVCYVCHRTPRSKRLAVDHDHATGNVRGLLCADSERGCNHAILGNITSLEMAKRIVTYLEQPPYARMLAGDPPEVRRSTHAEQVRRYILGEPKPVSCPDPDWHPGMCGCV